VQQHRVVAEEPQTVVAAPAQQLPNTARHVIVVEVLWLGITADGTPVFLGCPESRHSTPRHPVLAIEVAIAVRFALAVPALTTET
jgi:hypothetical protein